MPRDGLAGLTIAAFESRRATEMAELIRRHGGEPLVAPSLREIPLEQNDAALAFLEKLEAGDVDLTILLTGVGTRTLLDAVALRCPRDRFADLLAKTVVVVRGPKPLAVLREIGLSPAVIAPEPNTWQELLEAIDERMKINGMRVAVQEYGAPNHELIDGLRARGAEVVQVPVYRWALPDDVEPLRAVLRRCATGDIDAAIFTSATQVEHVLAVATEQALIEQVMEGLRRAVIASIGPVCSAALRKQGLPVDVEPGHPKMGQLVGALAASAHDILATKRNER